MSCRATIVVEALQFTSPTELAFVVRQGPHSVLPRVARLEDVDLGLVRPGRSLLKVANKLVESSALCLGHSERLAQGGGRRRRALRRESRLYRVQQPQAGARRRAAPQSSRATPPSAAVRPSPTRAVPRKPPRRLSLAEPLPGPGRTWPSRVLRATGLPLGPPPLCPAGRLQR
eukprot:scaffold215919_cov28-Tisochrysis_lutea.AAC.1